MEKMENLDLHIEELEDIEAPATLAADNTYCCTCSCCCSAAE
jgi:hypothetical protein